MGNQLTSMIATEPQFKSLSRKRFPKANCCQRTQSHLCSNQLLFTDQIIGAGENTMGIEN